MDSKTHINCERCAEEIDIEDARIDPIVGSLCAECFDKEEQERKLERVRVELEYRQMKGF